MCQNTTEQNEILPKFLFLVFTNNFTSVKSEKNQTEQEETSGKILLLDDDENIHSNYHHHHHQ